MMTNNALNFDTATKNLDPSKLTLLDERLLENRDNLIDTFVKESGFPADDVAELFEATMLFVRDFTQLETSAAARMNLERELISRIDPGASIHFEPWGRALICIPSNAPLPLAIALPLAFIAAGNQVIMAPSNRARQTSELAFSILNDLFPEQISLWPGRVREAIANLVDTGEVEHLYFLGGSGLRGTLAEKCATAGTHLIYEGEGNGVTIIDEELNDEQLRQTATQLVRAKSFCFGQMCSSPNVILCSKRNIDLFLAAFKEEAQKVSFPTSLQSYLGTELWDHLNHFVSDKAALETTGTLNQPALIQGMPFEKAVERELFSPAAFLCEYTDFKSAMATLSTLKHRLQVSLFSQDTDKVQELISGTRFARYCVNRCPTDQNPLLPWGNYGWSGQSEVRGFLMKAYRTVILESSI